MDNVQELEAVSRAEPRRHEGARIQSSGYLIELSLDWIVLRASENVHRMLGTSHVTLIDEPLGHFVHSQALHDLRNLFSRISGTTGIGRAYGVRLTDAPELVDIAFQLADGRVLLECVPSPGNFGEFFGTVGGLIAGLADNRGQSLLDGGTRRMRALTGFDRVTLVHGDQRSESSRGVFGGEDEAFVGAPPIVADCEAQPVLLFPRDAGGDRIAGALLDSPCQATLEAMRSAGVRSTMRVAFETDGMSGEFRCDCRTARKPSFELHAAAELFAQLFALRLEIDRLKGG